MSPAIKTAMTSEYTAMIPDMTTGMSDYRHALVSVSLLDRECRCTFMIRSGLNVPTPEIPMPDLAVPYAAPIPSIHRQSFLGVSKRKMHTSECHRKAYTCLPKS